MGPFGGAPGYRFVPGSVAVWRAPEGGVRLRRVNVACLRVPGPGRRDLGRVSGRDRRMQPVLSSPCPRGAVQPYFSTIGRERPNARASGETWRYSARPGQGMGISRPAVVHSRRQARMPRDAAQRRLSGECAMARARGRWHRDEFEKYEWWRKLDSRTNRLHLWTRYASSRMSAGGHLSRTSCQP